MFRRILLRSALLGSLGLIACARPATAPKAAVLSDDFFIRGTIVQVDAPWGFLVRGVSGTEYQVDRAFFTVHSGTEFRRRAGGNASVNDLTVGREISLWITGPIMESYPVQVSAQLIIVE